MQSLFALVPSPLDPLFWVGVGAFWIAIEGLASMLPNAQKHKGGAGLLAFGTGAAWMGAAMASVPLVWVEDTGGKTIWLVGVWASVSLALWALTEKVLDAKRPRGFAPDPEQKSIPTPDS